MLDHPVRISVLVITRDRPLLLRDLLRSLQDQTLAANQYEIIIIDNAPEPMSEWSERAEEMPVMRYAHAPNMTANAARTFGVGLARGDYIAFIDDDAIASPQWLQTLLHVFETISPTPACVGGRVELRHESPAPSWLSVPLKSYLGIVDHGPIARALLKNERLFLLNMAFKADVLRQPDAFPACMDRNEGRLLSNGEFPIQEAMNRENLVRYYSPNALVYHRIPANRVTLRWMLRRVFWQGVSDVVMTRETGMHAPGQRVLAAYGWMLCIPSLKNAVLVLCFCAKQCGKFCAIARVVDGTGFHVPRIMKF